MAPTEPAAIIYDSGLWQQDLSGANTSTEVDCLAVYCCITVFELLTTVTHCYICFMEEMRRLLDVSAAI